MKNLPKIPARIVTTIGFNALLLLSLTGCAAVFDKHPIGNTAVPQPAQSVEIDRYLGKWYEIARYEQGFQKDCDGVTAEYSRREDGNIKVVNRCRKPGGKIDVANGRAMIVDDPSGAKLKVSFFGPFYGDYWVLNRADDYAWAIVGEPDGRYLWILSRTPDLTVQEVAALYAKAAALGYDTSYLRRTKHP